MAAWHSCHIPFPPLLWLTKTSDGATPLDGVVAVLYPWWSRKNTHLLDIFKKNRLKLHKHKENVHKYHAVVLWFSDFWCRITLESLDGKNSFQAHIIEQHKSYRMVVESWKSVQVTLNAPIFARGTFCECLQIAYTKTFTAELMDIFELWDLNSRRVAVSSGLCLES